jgi:hypothetical protein
MSLVLGVVLKGLLLPGALAFALLLLPGGLWRRSSGSPGRRWVAPLAVGLGYVAAQLLLLGLPAFPPLDTTQWLLVLALVATLWGLAEAEDLGPRWSRALVSLVISLGSGYLLLRPLLGSTWTAATGWPWIAGMGLAIFALWQALGIWARRAEPIALPLVLMIWVAGTGLVLALSGSVLLGQLGGALAATLAAALLLELWNPAKAITSAAIAPLVVILSGLLLNGAFYSETPVGSVVLLVVSPGVAWLAGLLAALVKRRWLRVCLQGAAVLLPVLIAIWWAGSTAVEDPYAGY